MADARLLVVDDDPDIHVLLHKILGDTGCSIDSVTTGEQGLARLQNGAYDLVLTDICMPGLSGLDLLQQIHKIRPDTKVVVMTAQNTSDNLLQAIRDHAFTYFSKPFSPAALSDMIGRALESPWASGDIEVLSARPNWIALRLRCKMEIAETLVQFFRELQLGMTADEQADIAMAFRELLMNAIEHGGHSDPNQKVEVAYIRTARAILYQVRDPGEGFSFENLAHAAVSGTPDAPFRHVEVRSQAGMRPGGFGILMTRQVVDELIYNEKGNEVLLVKYLESEPRP